MKKIIYGTIGSVSLGLGIVGAFVPLLPSTCFALLAAWSFAKSSLTFHIWLCYKSPFATSIQNWQKYRFVPSKVKWIAATSMTVSFIITAVLVDNAYVLTAIGVGMLSVLIFLLTKPSVGNKLRGHKTSFSPIFEFRQPII